MVTFRPDQLVFKTDETARFGVAPDFDLGYDSADGRLNLDDLVNAQTAYVPQNRSGDLVDGRLAQTVDEGKALADDGVVYDSIQTAVNNASSYVKVGPGYFNESVDMGTKQLTLHGSGKQTVIVGTSAVLDMYTDSTVAHLKVVNDEPTSTLTIDHEGYLHDVEVVGGEYGIRSVSGVVENCYVHDSYSGIFGRGDKIRIVNNTIKNVEYWGIPTDFNSGEMIVASNHVENTGNHGIYIDSDDTVVYGNRVHRAGLDGLQFNNGNDNIGVNNRISDSGGSDITDDAISTLLSDNKTGSAN